MKKLTKANNSHARLSVRGQLLLVALCLATAWLGFWAYAVLAEAPATGIRAEADTLLGSSAPNDVTTRAVTPTIRIDPVTSTADQAGESITVSVKIDNVTNLRAFEIQLSYNANIVHVTGCMTQTITQSPLTLKAVRSGWEVAPGVKTPTCPSS
jgi:hypothetical protein